MTSGYRLDLLKKVARDYQELNGVHIDTLYNPSSIDFLRSVRIGRPVIIKGFSPPALDKWDDEYLIEKMGERPVSVAVTPNGNADAIVDDANGRKYFTEPHTEKITIKELLDQLSSDSKSSKPANSATYYLQSQNGNMYTATNDEPQSEFEPLLEDVPSDVPWATEGLGIFPDAVNIWIGDERSVTSVHSDPYENVYTVIRGKKHFTLFPPTEGWCLKEKMYPHARYYRENNSSPFSLIPSPPSVAPVRWSSIRDPLNPEELPPEACPIQVTISEGDTLYLPVGWWHHVRQSGVTIALNWWYDMEAKGMGWVMLNFLRGESEDVPDGN